VGVGGSWCHWTPWLCPRRGQDPAPQPLGLVLLQILGQNHSEKGLLGPSQPGVRPTWLQGIPRPVSSPSTSVRAVGGGGGGGWSCPSSVLRGPQGQRGLRGAGGCATLRSRSGQRCSLILFHISRKGSVPPSFFSPPVWVRTAECGLVAVIHGGSTANHS